MKVKVAETAGFCFGVQRAVDRVYDLIGSDAAPIYTLGPIIHNEEVVSDLEKKRRGCDQRGGSCHFKRWHRCDTFPRSRP